MTLRKIRSLGTQAVAVVTALAVASVLPMATPAMAQVRSVDPDAAIDGDLAPGQNSPAAASPNELPSNNSPGNGTPIESTSAPVSPTWSPPSSPQATEQGQTYRKDDLIGAAEGVFGKGAQGLAGMIEDILRKQGEPNGYIVGREGSGAIGVGLRYGSGTLHHKVEGERPVYWTGPSIGFDAGLNAGSAFVLVYNLYDTEDLYKRFPAGEGQAYLVGGFHVSYLRRGNIVLIPVRMGAGLRLGVNAGYMKFTHKQSWMPF